jgi:hypothetical protein
MIKPNKITVKKVNCFITWNYRLVIVVFALKLSRFKSHKPSLLSEGG